MLHPKLPKPIAAQLKELVLLHKDIFFIVQLKEKVGLIFQRKYRHPRKQSDFRHCGIAYSTGQNITAVVFFRPAFWHKKMLYSRSRTVQRTPSKTTGSYIRHKVLNTTENKKLYKRMLKEKDTLIEKLFQEKK